MTRLHWTRCIALLGSLAGLAQAQPVNEPAIAPANPTTPAAAQPSEPVLSETSARAAGFALRGLGLRSSVARVDGSASPGNDWNGGGELYERGVGVLRLENWSGRYFDEMWIGYGTEGWRYQLSGQFALGAMWLFQQSHGPLLRFAMRGDLRREGGVYSSELRLPGGELGYSWTRGTAQVELLGHAGTTLTGRFHPEGRRRSLHGGTYGASFSLGWNHVRLDTDVSWVAARADLDAVLHARAHLCGLSQDRWGGNKTRKERQKDVGQPPAAPGWALCGDFRALRGRTQMGGALTEISTQYVVGVSVVLGQLGHL